MHRPSEISCFVFTGAPAGQHGWLITFREQNSFQTSRIQRPDRNIGAVKMSDEKKSPLDQVAKGAAFGTAVGFCSGYALKTVGKSVAVLVGMGFIALQLAQAQGYISVDWGKVERGVTSTLDQDGDGQLTPEDLRIAKEKMVRNLSIGLPSQGAGFAVGFYMGMKMKSFNFRLFFLLFPASHRHSSLEQIALSTETSGSTQHRLDSLLRAVFPLHSKNNYLYEGRKVHTANVRPTSVDCINHR
eukprot:g63200.t1